MAYKQNPGRGNQPKTGRGIPAPFKQTVMGAVGAGAGTATGKYVTKKVKEAGKAVSSANEAGKKAYDNSMKGESFWGGSGAKRTYSKNPVEYVKGFASDLVSDKNPKTNEKKKPVAKQMKNSPVKQMETIKKVYDKGKELVSKAGKAVSSANEAGQKAYDKSAKGASFWGGSGAKRTYEKNPVEYVKGFASDLMSDKNPKTKEKKKSPAKMKNSPMKQGLVMTGKPAANAKPYKGSELEKKNKEKKSPMKQLGRQAVTKMGGKKAPAKMKKC
jgi:hypothetical protein